MSTSPSKHQYQEWVIAPLSFSSRVQNWLGKKKLLDSTLKLVRSDKAIHTNFCWNSSDVPKLTEERHCAIPTNIHFDISKYDDLQYSKEIGELQTTGYPFYICHRRPSAPPPALSEIDTKCYSKSPSNRLSLATLKWLESLPTETQALLPKGVRQLVADSSPSYNKLGDLLVLTAGMFTREPWRQLLTDGDLAEWREGLWSQVCKVLDVEKVGVNGAIPLQVKTESANNQDAKYVVAENVMRKPTGFYPLYGDFGGLEEPSKEAYERAYWVDARQNNVQQMFAPLHTMFSRGNIKEKQRLLELDDLRINEERKVAVTAVDLYAGIGYFAFSYAKAGVDKVLCWELNKWSVEGFRRGSVRNRWTVRVVEEGEKTFSETQGQSSSLDYRLVMFNETNERALQRIEEVRSLMPPITHVNCGYLPSSEPIWKDAVHMIHPDQVGWVHAHENVAIKDIETRKGELVRLFSTFVAHDSRDGSISRHVECSHVEKVKTYAPGVIHCVFDMSIGPQSTE